MGTLKYRGIIIKEAVKGESNKQITVLTKEHGKVLMSVKGAKNIKSKNFAGSQLFTYGDFYAFDGRNFKSVLQIDIIENFYGIRNDVVSLSYASYFTEVINEVIHEEMEAEDILELLLRSLLYLANNKKEPSLISRVFEIKLLQLSGFLAYQKECSRCGREFDERYFFSEEYGGMVCEGCGKDSFEIGKGTYDAWNFILEKDLKNAFSFGMSEKTNNELKQITKLLFDNHINRRFKSLEIAESLEF